MFEKHSDDRTDHGELEAYADLCSLVHDYPRNMIKGDSPDWSNGDIGLEITICTSKEWLEVQNRDMRYKSIRELMKETYDSHLQVSTVINHNGENKTVDIDLRDRVIRNNNRSVPYDTLSKDDKATIGDNMVGLITNPRKDEFTPDSYCLTFASFKNKVGKLKNYTDSREYHLYIHSGEWFPLSLTGRFMNRLKRIAKGSERSYSTVFLSVNRFLLAFHLDSGKITLYPRKSGMVKPDPDGSLKDVPDNLAHCYMALGLDGIDIPDCNGFDMIPMPYTWNAPPDKSEDYDKECKDIEE